MRTFFRDSQRERFLKKKLMKIMKINADKLLNTNSKKLQNFAEIYGQYFPLKSLENSFLVISWGIEIFKSR